MLWNLRSLKDLGGRVHLDALYRRLGQLLRIPEDLLWLEYPPESAAGDTYIVRHHMRFALTDLRYLKLVNTHGRGNWSLTDRGADFLKPLDEEDVPMAGRQWSRRTGISLTPAEGKLERKLIADKRAEHRRRFPRRRGNGGTSAPSQPSPRNPKPDGWPTEVFSNKPKPPESDTAD
jgi:hypothetical protein